MKAPYLKPQRSSGNLMNLPFDQQTQLLIWLITAVPYAEMKGLVETEFKVECKSIEPIKLFWKKEGKAAMKWQRLRQDHATPAGWELLRRDAVKALEDLKTTPAQRKALLKFLETGRYHKPNPDYDPPGSESSGAENASTENKEIIEEVTPLDDQEKLDEIRRQVFGSAPNTKKSDPPTS